MSAICISLCSTIGLISISAGIISLPTYLYLHEHKQLVDDWTSRPFVDVVIESADNGCSLDYEPLFNRIWNGTAEVCQEGDYRIGIYDVRELEKDQPCDGDIIAPIKPMNMTADGGIVICGKRGGPNFIETVRVNPGSLKCPKGFTPCSELTPPSETVCVEIDADKESKCPIIDLFAIPAD